MRWHSVENDSLAYLSCRILEKSNVALQFTKSCIRSQNRIGLSHVDSRARLGSLTGEGVWFASLILGCD
jgi:hypothetical protein